MNDLKTSKTSFFCNILSILITSFGIGYTLICCSGDVNGPKIEVSGAGHSLEYITPEEVGWSSEKLEEARSFAKHSGYAAVLALYDGKVFFSWGDIQKNYWCHSIRKPFLSALYGIHLARGYIDLDATLEDLHIDDIPPGLTLDEKQAKVEHLLKSRSGVYHEAAAEPQVMIDTRPERGSHSPDAFFFYNNWDFNTLGTIFEQETGREIFSAFKSEIADVIGMQDFSVDNCSYHHEWDKSMHPAYLFRMSARDMARFGVLYQRNGNWQGLQVIPEQWIEESTLPHSITEDNAGHGYGYMWQIFPEGSEIEQLVGYPCYAHTGAGVHALVIIPELKLVIVERYDTDGDWVDPGEVGLDLGIKIIEARLEE